MSENKNELYELEDLKVAYNLMDERLDGQEIVSDEQLICRYTSEPQRGIGLGHCSLCTHIGMARLG